MLAAHLSLVPILRMCEALFPSTAYIFRHYVTFPFTFILSNNIQVIQIPLQPTILDILGV
jgi:hypothetical protein